MKEFPDGAVEAAMAKVDRTTQALVKAEPAGRLLAKLDQATRMLAEARTLDEVAQIVNVTEAVKTYAQAAKLGLEAHNHAAEINLRAQRKAGEMLAKLDKGKGGRPAKTADKVSEVSEYRRTIDEAQVHPKTATTWQRVAAVPDERFKEYIEHEKKYCEELSTAGLLRDAKKRAGDSAPKPLDEFDGRAKVNNGINALEEAIADFLKLWPKSILDFYPDRRLLAIADLIRRERERMTEAPQIVTVTVVPPEAKPQVAVITVEPEPQGDNALETFWKRTSGEIEEHAIEEVQNV